MADAQLAFGPFLLDTRARRLLKNGAPVAITVKAFDILAALVEDAGRVVDKDDLMHRVWPDSVVEEANLSQQIFLLRRLLGEAAKDPRYIATVPRRGYRFVATVTDATAGAGAADDAEANSDTDPRTAARAAARDPALIPGHGDDEATLRLTLSIGAAAPLALGACPPFVLSPDGRVLAYIAWEGDQTALFLRRLDRTEAVRIAATEGAYAPFFSPDSRWVGFFARGRLSKVLVGGGTPLVIAEAGEDCRGASWGSRNDIVFAPTPASGLTIIAADEPVSRPLTVLDFDRGERTHRWPHVLPNGTELLFTVARAGSASFDDADVMIASVATGTRRVLLRHATCARYVPTGHIVYMRAGTMMAVPFDLQNLVVTGSPAPVVDRVMTQPTGGGHFAFANTGCLVYLTGEVQRVQRQLVTLEASGAVHPVPLPEQEIEEPRLSPNGRKLALGIRAATSDIWVYDFARSTLTRMTFDGDNFAAVWTPDGTRLTFSSNRTGPCQIYWRAADGAGADERLVASEYDLVPGPWSRDGRVLVFTEYHPETGASIWMCTPHEPAPPRPLLRSRFNEHGPALSPDNQWLAYTSDESGRAEVYVVSFPALDRKAQMSVDGGTEAIWARDGRRLYYRRGASILSVDVADGPEPVAGAPQRCVEGPYLPGAMTGLPNYDVTADGAFLMIRQEASQTRPDQLAVVVNWFADLRRRLA